ncbi:MAG: FAD-binding oxidoreductase [Bacillota bacterium]
MDKEIINDIKNIVGENWVDTNPERVNNYSLESTHEAYGLVAPEPVTGSIVVKPAGKEEISEIMKYANKNDIKVIVKGGGTALSANAVPEQPLIILSMERLNEVLEVDEDNFVIKCQAAVTLGDLNETLQKEKFYFPLHPGEEGAHVGGMVVMNAGGVRAVRHGIMRNQVQGMEVVLPTGEIVRYGGKTGKLVKDNAGYNLMQLMIGSEGTLGIITEVTLKIYKEPEVSGTLIISYDKREDAFKTVPEILKLGITPVAIEFVENKEIMAAAEEIGKNWPVENGNAYLMIILEEEDEDKLYDMGMMIDEVSEKLNARDMVIAQTTSEQQDILDIRSHILPAIQDRLVDSPDTTVPPTEIDNFLEFVEKMEIEYDTEIPVIAHAGDGNMHLCILKKDGEIPSYYEELKEKLYKKAIEMGGTITGEHGVGKLRLKYLPLQFTSRELDIMWQIKQAFDPNNILNPGSEIFEPEK